MIHEINNICQEVEDAIRDFRVWHISQGGDALDIGDLLDNEIIDQLVDDVCGKVNDILRRAPQWEDASNPPPPSPAFVYGAWVCSEPVLTVDRFRNYRMAMYCHWVEEPSRDYWKVVGDQWDAPDPGITHWIEPPEGPAEPPEGPADVTPT